MKRLFGLGFILLILTGLLVACGGTDDVDDESADTGDVEEKKVLKMATSADFPPFESRNPAGEFIGLDIDIATLIAEDLGYELEIEDMSFDGLVGALQASRVDMVMAGMSMDEKRRKNVDFSIEYNHSDQMFLSKSDKAIESLEELAGKTVGVQLGTIQEEGADKLSKEYDFEVKKIDDVGTLIQEILSNRVDVIYMDTEVAVGYIDTQGLIGFEDPSQSSPGMGIAFPKGSELVEDVDKVLEELEESGKLQELKDKWLTSQE